MVLKGLSLKRYTGSKQNTSLKNFLVKIHYTSFPVASFAGMTHTWLIERLLCFAWKRYGFIFWLNNKFFVLNFSKVEMSRNTYNFAVTFRNYRNGHFWTFFMLRYAGIQMNEIITILPITRSWFGLQQLKRLNGFPQPSGRWGGERRRRNIELF